MARMVFAIAPVRMFSMTNEQEQDFGNLISAGHIDHDVFRAIADCTYDWESWHAPDGKLVWVNAAVERMTGCSPAECLKMPDYPLPLVAVEDREKVAAVMADAKEGGSGNDVEFRGQHRDGSERWMAVSWQPMSDLSHRHLGFRASVRDVTERHQLREELRMHNQHLEQLVQERTAKIAQLEEHRLRMEKLAALGQMAAGVAHEVNNPLAGIRNAFALFKSSLPEDDENYELLELIDSEIDRISAITHQMYQLYRPSQQQATTFDLERTIAGVVALLQPQATKSKVQIDVITGQCQPAEQLEATQVELREGEVKQILFNIVRNAIQASPRSGVVKIEFTLSNLQATISVTDQGAGVTADVAKRLFEPFFTTKSDTTRQGMGLGLSVSRSLAEAMNGAIDVDHKFTNGACFKVTLPRRLKQV
ncbi:Sporulation kinase A [Fuerstiella marisgermanici]|uniref:histidine kinase n=2 Tax=Fuerstiella marisgermanici TaxID=1891926 RepID=A0A1P8WJN4_9PLAN|nr:Sporulation kinase A [Fuerstiella marisgermanici]